MQRHDLDVSRLTEVFTKDKLDSIVKTHKSILNKINCKNSLYSSITKSSIEIESKSLYYYITYVYMLEESFSINSYEMLELLSEICMLIICPFQHFVLANYEEKEDINTPANYLQLQIGMCEGIEKLQKILSKENMEKFWDYFYKYCQEILEGANLFKENHNNKLNSYTTEELYKISIGLNAHSKIVLPILAGINSEFEKVSDLEASLNHYYVAHKLFLDLKIWKKDLERGFFTPILTDVISENNIEPKDKDRIMDILYGNKYDEKYLILANREVEKALFLCGNNSPCQKSLRSIQSRINLLLYDFRTLKGELKRVFPYSKPIGKYTAEDLKNQIVRSTNWLISQYDSGYPELIHWGVFLHPYGFTGDEQALPGDVYYRSYLLNLMYSMRNSVFIKDSFFKNELSYLSKRKHRYYTEGWGHFPDLPELPPDIGTLGEIITNAIYSEDSLLLKELEEIADRVIQKNPNKDGTINYWLTDKDMGDFFKNTSSVKCIYIRTLLKKMYKNTIISGNAQFIFSLSLLNNEKYANVIDTVYSAILKKQNSSGNWKDYYFTGNFFTIWQILRCANKLNRLSLEIPLSLTYILENQHENGSWGQVFGDPKETAYGILSLIELLELSEKNSLLTENERINILNSISTGVSYLLGSVTDNYWHGVDFAEIQIKKISTEPADFIEYRSATLTTGISTYALNRYYNYLKFI